MDQNFTYRFFNISGPILDSRITKNIFLNIGLFLFLYPRYLINDMKYRLKIQNVFQYYGEVDTRDSWCRSVNLFVCSSVNK